MCELELAFFFFQAEDGIRDLVRSRGLGDVYKRQDGSHAVGQDVAEDDLAGRRADGARGQDELILLQPVSYTHLTLPTSDLVEISVVAGSFKKKLLS